MNTQKVAHAEEHCFLRKGLFFFYLLLRRGGNSSLDFTRQQMSEGASPYLIPISNAALILPQQACQMSGSHVLFLAYKHVRTFVGATTNEQNHRRNRKSLNSAPNSSFKKSLLGSATTTNYYPSRNNLFCFVMICSDTHTHIHTLRTFLCVPNRSCWFYI